MMKRRKDDIASVKQYHFTPYVGLIIDARQSILNVSISKHNVLVKYVSNTVHYHYPTKIL